MGRRVSIIYGALLGVGGICILLALWFSREYVFDPAGETEEILLEPSKVVQVNADVREYTIDLDADTRFLDSLVFYTTHQYIEVFEGDACLYSVKGRDSLFGRTTGARWNFVKLPFDARQVRVRATAVYSSVRDYEITFYQGNALEMVIRMLRGSMVEIGVSVVDFALGLLLLVYYMIVRKRLEQGPAMGYFGLFSVMMGLWTLNEAQGAVILFPWREAASFIGYILVILMIAPFVAYVQAFLEVADKRISNVLCVLSQLAFVVCTFLHMTAMVPFKQTVTAAHFLMVCALGYLLYALVKRIRRVGYDRKAQSSILGLLILSLSFVFDAGAFYLDAIHTDVVGRFGFLLYICILGKEAANGAREKLEEGRKAEIYKELAVKDVLTGLKNRNAYDAWVGEHWKEEGTTILAFDLNDLKLCNDTLGHAAGDQYLQDAAAILTKVFFPAGNCYRIGGDEFCVIVQQVEDDWVKERLSRMEMLEREYNRTSDVVRMQIAYGYARFCAELDSNIEDTRNRADAQMYENKRAQKARKL